MSSENYFEGDFNGIVAELHRRLMDAPPVQTESWQGLKNVPHTATKELQDVVIKTQLPGIPDESNWIIEPNQPWADMHFAERVGGDPLNPPPSHTAWPWFSPDWKAQNDNGQFEHTYPERMWPRTAGQDGPTHHDNRGIRYRLGDLNDLVDLLYREPHTRQAYLPLFFPEDTGAHHGGRVPCTLGTLFMYRDGKFHTLYFIRSMDFLRYLRDDIYFTNRLAQWMISQLKYDTEERPTHNPAWDSVLMGMTTIHIGSLHIFQGDMGQMRRTSP